MISQQKRGNITWLEFCQLQQITHFNSFYQLQIAIHQVHSQKQWITFAITETQKPEQIQSTARLLTLCVGSLRRRQEHEEFLISVWRAQHKSADQWGWQAASTVDSHTLPRDCCHPISATNTTNPAQQIYCRVQALNYGKFSWTFLQHLTFSELTACEYLWFTL